MKLHQIKIEHNAGHDRLLLRLSTRDGKELLFWLTRRCVKSLWPALMQIAQSSARIALQSDPEARAALLGFEHERALRKADFATAYDEAARERPLGDEPALVTHIQRAKGTKGSPALSLTLYSGQNVNIALDDALLHSFCRLLQAAVDKAEWDIALALPRAYAADAVRGSRTIN